jgi:hypothetical protein
MQCFGDLDSERTNTTRKAVRVASNSTFMSLPKKIFYEGKGIPHAASCIMKRYAASCIKNNKLWQLLTN